MACAVYQVTTCLLLLVAVGSSGVQPKRIIYIDEGNGTLNPSCCDSGTESLCESVEVVLDGAEQHNSTVVFVKHKCKIVPSADAPDGTPCPTWFFADPSANGTCRCGNDIDGAVRCNDSTKEVAILRCYCMTYSESTGPVVGTCFYNCLHPTLQSALYHPLPSNATKLSMCEYFNRAGQLCGDCKENYSIPVYSYDLKCVQCSTSHLGWLKYILAAFLPLTVFFILVLSFRLSATSPKLSAFVFVSQLVAMGGGLRVALADLDIVPYPMASISAKILFTIYGIWNLDFFRTLIPHICVSTKIDTLQALTLDYAIAFYPLILLVITYVVLTCNITNRVISFMCRPFNRCAEHFRNQLDVRASIVEAFATFLLLSYVKLLSVSFDLLVPTHVYNVNGSLVGMYLYYDATIEYFGDKHLPYAVLALFVMLVFILFPILLLLLYPMRCFQQCLGCCGVRWHALHIFIDAFQGCYKDGTNGTRDCWYFATAFLIARISLFIIFVLSPTALFYAAALFVFITLAIMITTMQPFKPQFSIHNTVDSVLVLLLALWCASVVCINTAGLKAHWWLKFFLVLSFIVPVLPLLYISFVTLHWMCCRRKFGQRMIGKISGRIRAKPGRAITADAEESLPYRLINPVEYEEDGTDPVAVHFEDNDN